MTEHCLTCQSTSLTDVRTYRTKTRHGKDLFGGTRLYQCGDCGLVQTVPRPTLDQLSDYYEIDYRNGCCAGLDVADSATFPKDNLFYYNRGQSIAELVGPYVSRENPRILDIGAGYGHILAALAERFPGAERTAIEFSQVCVDHLRALGIDVRTDAVEEALPALNCEFDLIVLSHVFEHLLDPIGTLQLIRDHLAPEGVLYVEVPHIPEEGLRCFPDHVWAPRFEEPHITLFSVRALRHALETGGFHVQFCQTAGGKYKYISRLRFHLPHWRWFIQSVIPDSMFHFLRRQRITRSLRVAERVPSFYEYGGERIWIRSISQARS